MKIGIFPGSFDPVHNGHLALAITAADALGLDQVIFVPSGVSPNKRNTQRTPGTKRFQWIQKALAGTGDPRLVVSDHESRHSVPTYTLETIEALGGTLGKNNCFMLVGSDTAHRMQRWPSYQKILKIATITAFGRDGAAGTIVAPEWPHSSTEIRTKILGGQSITGLAPDSIIGDLETHFQTKIIPCCSTLKTSSN